MHELILDQIEMAIRTHRTRHHAPGGLLYWKHEDQMTENALQAAADALRAPRSMPHPEEQIRLAAQVWEENGLTEFGREWLACCMAVSRAFAKSIE